MESTFSRSMSLSASSLSLETWSSLELLSGQLPFKHYTWKDRRSKVSHGVNGVQPINIDIKELVHAKRCLACTYRVVDAHG